jgi:hypothetical protein
MISFRNFDVCNVFNWKRREISSVTKKKVGLLSRWAAIAQSV